MSWDTDLVEILKTSRDSVHEEIIHLRARENALCSDSDLQWFAEMLERQSGACMAERTSTPAGPEKLASMPFEVTESIAVDDSDHRPRTLARVRVPRLSGIRVRLPGKILEVNGHEEVPVQAVEKPAPRMPQETVRQEPKPQRSVKKPPKVTRSVSPAREEKPVEAPKKPVEADARLVPPPKPLKVIRRRRAEEPKIFETAPKSFPRAMLAGVKVTPDETGEQPLD